jgi:hypothetical protein
MGMTALSWHFSHCFLSDAVVCVFQERRITRKNIAIILRWITVRKEIIISSNSKNVIAMDKTNRKM